MVLQIRRFVVRSLSGCEGHNLFTCAFENAVRLYRYIVIRCNFTGKQENEAAEKGMLAASLKKRSPHHRGCAGVVSHLSSLCFLTHLFTVCHAQLPFLQKKTKSKRVLSG